MFSGTFIPPALGFTRGLAFCSGFFLSLLFFLHSEASSKCNFGRGVLPQCLGRHRFSHGCWSVAPPHSCPLAGDSCPAQQIRVLDVLPGSGGRGELCPSQQPRGCSQVQLSLPKAQLPSSTMALLPALRKALLPQALTAELTQRPGAGSGVGRRCTFAHLLLIWWNTEPFCITPNPAR